MTELAVAYITLAAILIAGILTSFPHTWQGPTAIITIAGIWIIGLALAAWTIAR